jgi:hypothetical protein
MPNKTSMAVVKIQWIGEKTSGVRICSHLDLAYSTNYNTIFNGKFKIEKKGVIDRTDGNIEPSSASPWQHSARIPPPLFLTKTPHPNRIIHTLELLDNQIASQK